MKEFYKKIKMVEPRPLLKKAFDYLEGVDSEFTAYDLGCGVGQDSFGLVNKGFSVKAVDISADAFEYMNTRFGTSESIEQIVSGLEDLEMDKTSLVNASLVLPFVKKEEFSAVVERIQASIIEKGLFVGNFFGPKDGWAQRLVSKSKEEVEGMFSDFEILHIAEEEFRKESAAGPVKDWHIIEIIARK